FCGRSRYLGCARGYAPAVILLCPFLMLPSLPCFGLPPRRLATFRRKNRLLIRSTSGVSSAGSVVAVFGPVLTFCRLEGENSSDIDQIVGDHSQTDPAFHTVIATISTPIQAMASLE